MKKSSSYFRFLPDELEMNATADDSEAARFDRGMKKSSSLLSLSSDMSDDTDDDTRHVVIKPYGVGNVITGRVFGNESLRHGSCPDTFLFLAVDGVLHPTGLYRSHDRAEQEFYAADSLSFLKANVSEIKHIVDRTGSAHASVQAAVVCKLRRRCGDRYSR
jgi:hypothetical protein